MIDGNNNRAWSPLLRLLCLFHRTRATDMLPDLNYHAIYYKVATGRRTTCQLWRRFTISAVTLRWWQSTAQTRATSSRRAQRSSAVTRARLWIWRASRRLCATTTTRLTRTQQVTLARLFAAVATSGLSRSSAAATTPRSRRTRRRCSCRAKSSTGRQRPT